MDPLQWMGAVRTADKNIEKLINYLLQTWSFLLHKILIDGLESWVLLVNYCVVFINCLLSHSDGTHSGYIGDQVM